jgi:hypothetical protein
MSFGELSYWIDAVAQHAEKAGERGGGLGN